MEKWKKGKAQSERGLRLARVFTLVYHYSFAAFHFILPCSIPSQVTASQSNSAIHTDEDVHSIHTGTTQQPAKPVILLWAKLSHEEERRNQRQQKPTDGRTENLPKCQQTAPPLSMKNWRKSKSHSSPTTSVSSPRTHSTPAQGRHGMSFSPVVKSTTSSKRRRSNVPTHPDQPGGSMCAMHRKKMYPS